MNIETAGARLKKIRQERGLTLEDVQKKTKIHLNVLRTIEGDSLSDLSPIYLKSFIKIYCNCLGLDPKEYTGEAIPQRKPVLNATIGRDIGERIEKKSFIKNASLRLVEMKPSFDFKKIIIFTLAAIIFIVLVSNFIKFITSGRKGRLEKAKILIPVMTPKASVKQSKVLKESVSGFTLGIFARNKSWISAKVDGKVIFHGVLARGRSETWHAKEKVELSLGDAGAVELQINDQRFSTLGRRGQPLKNVLIDKNGLKISR